MAEQGDRQTLFEKVIAGDIPAEVVYEDELTFAFKDISPQAPVHVLIVPRRVIPRVGEATGADRETLGQLLLAAGRVADKLGVNATDEGFRLINTGIMQGRNGNVIPFVLHKLDDRKTSS